jgi:hypothetical protein
MPIGFKAFKGLGRRKSSTPPSEPVEPSSPIGTSTFRVIPRGGNVGYKGIATLDKPLPTLDYRRTWSEEDNSSSNRYGYRDGFNVLLKNRTLTILRASDSTTSTANSRGYDRYSDKSRMSDKGHQYTSPKYTSDTNHRGSPLGPPNEQSSYGYLDMPSAMDSNEDFGNMFNGTNNDQRPQSNGGRPELSSPTPVKSVSAFKDHMNLNLLTRSRKTGLLYQTPNPLRGSRDHIHERLHRCISEKVAISIPPPTRYRAEPPMMDFWRQHLRLLLERSPLHLLRTSHLPRSPILSM